MLPADCYCCGQIPCDSAGILGHGTRKKNRTEKLLKQSRNYFKKSRHLRMKTMEKLTDDEMHQLVLMFEIAPRLAGAYRINKRLPFSDSQLVRCRRQEGPCRLVALF